MRPGAGRGYLVLAVGLMQFFVGQRLNLISFCCRIYLNPSSGFCTPDVCYKVIYLFFHLIWCILYPGCVSCLSFDQQSKRQVAADQTLLLLRQRRFCWHVRHTHKFPWPTALKPFIPQVVVILHSQQAYFNKTCHVM